MGRTLPSASIVFYQMKDGFKKFERALAPRDQRALQELFIYANKHIAEVQLASSPFSEDIFMLAMLLEMHKQVLGLEKGLEDRSNKKKNIS